MALSAGLEGFDLDRHRIGIFRKGIHENPVDQAGACLGGAEHQLNSILDLGGDASLWLLFHNDTGFLALLGLTHRKIHRER